MGDACANLLHIVAMRPKIMRDVWEAGRTGGGCLAAAVSAFISLLNGQCGVTPAPFGKQVRCVARLTCRLQKNDSVGGRTPSLAQGRLALMSGLH